MPTDPKTGQPLDRGVIALAKSIRTVESNNNYNAVGDNGTSRGAYQFHGDNYKNWAKQYGIDPNDFSPVAQDKVAYYKLQDYKRMGFTPEQVAAAWNGGPGIAANDKWRTHRGTTNINGKSVAYNVPKYVDKVIKNYQQYRQGGGQPNQQAGGNVYAQGGQYDVNPGSYQQAQSQQPEKMSVGGLLGNTVKGFGSAVGGIANVFLHPVKTAQGVGEIIQHPVKNVLRPAYEASGAKDLVQGHPIKALKTLGKTAYNDPVAFALNAATLGTGLGGTVSKLGKVADFAKAADLARGSDFISTAAGLVPGASREAAAALRTTGNLTKTGEAITRASELIDPLSAASKLTKKVFGFGGKVASGSLGLSTGAGGEAIQEAYKAGRTGGSRLDDFTQALRGKTDPDAILGTAQAAVRDIKDARQAEYVQQLNTIVKKGSVSAKNVGTLPKAPIQETLNTQLGNFGVKIGPGGKLDFSSSTLGDRAAQGTVRQVYKDISEWKDFTPQGLDTLKRRLDSYYSPASDARAFTQAAKVSVRKTLVENVPGYEKMTKGYEEASDALKEAQFAIGGQKASQESALRKLRNIFKDSQKDRLGTIQKVEGKTGRNISGQVAGLNLNPIVPGGLAKFVAETGLIGSVATGNLGILPGLLAASPRFIGEIARSLGVSARRLETIISALEKTTKLPRNQILLLLYQANARDAQSGIAGTQPPLEPPTL